MPMRWIVRRDVDGKEVGDPLRCYDQNVIIAVPGVRSIEQCLVDLLRPGEECLGQGEKRPIMFYGKYVGHIETRRD
jgi:hypothetical protein